MAASPARCCSTANSTAKRHVLRDLDTGLVPVVGITPANVPEAAVTDDIAADLQAAGMSLAELHIDRAYLSSALVRDRGPDLVIFCKAWRVRNASGRFAKDQFTLDFAAGQLTCPAGISMPFAPGRPSASPRTPAPRARCGHGAPPAATAVAYPSTPTKHCWPSCAAASTRRTDARSSANASRSNTPSPTSGTGRAAAPATAALARTCSTSAGSRRGPQPPRHRPPARHQQLPASRLTAT